MAEAGGRARAAAWLLLGIAAVALGGCFERHEPSNPFIGPFGSSEEGSFGALPAAGSADQASALQPAPAQPASAQGEPALLAAAGATGLPPSQ
jgi:hypothetical protein